MFTIYAVSLGIGFLMGGLMRCIYEMAKEDF